jgi:uncharacterized protein
MKLENSFTVPVPVGQAWEVLLDVERVAPCMPGATLESADGEKFTGHVKVKAGPVTLAYQGTASIISADAHEHVAVISAQGKTRGGTAPGTAAATVTMRLTDLGQTTGVDLHTELKLTGRQAQLGRHAIPEVAGGIIQQFADNLATRLTAGPATPSSRSGTAAPTAPGPVPGAAAAPAAPAPNSTNQAARPVNLLTALARHLARRIQAAARARLRRLLTGRRAAPEESR